MCRALFLLLAMPLVVEASAPFLTAQQQPSFCAPRKEKYTIVKHKGEHPMPKAPPDKALIYIISWSKVKPLYREKVSINGKWVADLRNKNYTYCEVEAGLLRFCTYYQYSPESYLFLTAEAGKIYYIRVAYVGKLLELVDSEAEPLLSECQFVTMEPKH